MGLGERVCQVSQDGVVSEDWEDQLYKEAFANTPLTAAEPPSTAARAIAGDIENSFATAMEDFKNTGRAFAMSGKVGHHWSRELRKNDQLRQEYKNCGNEYSAQRAFRMNWARARFGRCG